MSSGGFRVLPSYAYGDPARIIETQELRELGCTVCVRAESAFGLSVCTKGLKYPTCRQDRKNGYKLTPEAGG